MTTSELFSCFPPGTIIQVGFNFLKCYRSRRDLNLDNPLHVQPSFDIDKFVGDCMQKITEIESLRKSKFAGYTTRKLFEFHSKQLSFKENP